MFCHGKEIGAVNNKISTLTGFSLIEIMLTLVIVSVLMSVSIPIYSQHFIQQNRFAAKTLLLKLAGALEQYYLENNTYQEVTLARLGFKELVVNNQYVLAINVVDIDHFVVSARPVGKQMSDVKCGVLGLDSMGKKSISGKGEAGECW
jgi:type IV pilus assembly protein PilE